MSIDWSGWTAFEGAPGRPLHEVARPVAQRYFDELMAAREERKAHLVRLLARNGVEIATDDGGLQRLDDWYRENVAASPDDPERLADRWFALGLDIGLFLGDAMIEREPSLEWRLFTQGKHDVAYQRPVLMGFPGARNPRYNVDPEMVVSVHGHRIVAGLDEPRDQFVQMVRSVEPVR